MRIEHIAIWVDDLEQMKQFYEKYFHAAAGDLYSNPTNHFKSYFLSFDGGCRLELMTNTKAGYRSIKTHPKEKGLAHFAISVGSKEEVDRLTSELSKKGIQISGKSRWTGDGYYESIILDPEGNSIEITI